MVVSSEHFFEGESKIVNQLFEEGLQRFHLRKPKSSAEDLERFINQIHPDFRSKISLHDHHHLAPDLGIYRLHLKEKLRVDLGVDLVGVISNSAYKYSTSVHSVEELKVIATQIEYAFLSPVFDSISKSNYHGFSSANFKIKDEWKRTKVIGLGGIEESNISQLKDMNFDGAAVLGYVWKKPEDAVKNFLKLKKYAE